jgi:lipopolysaccharide biosynthesis protein
MPDDNTVKLDQDTPRPYTIVITEDNQGNVRVLWDSELVWSASCENALQLAREFAQGLERGITGSYQDLGSFSTIEYNTTYTRHLARTYDSWEDFYSDH